MKGLNGFDIPGFHIYRTEKVITRILIVTFVVIVLITPWLCSCSTLKLRNDYCHKKQIQHVQSIYNSYWFIHPVRHLQKPQKK